MKQPTKPQYSIAIMAVVLVTVSIVWLWLWVGTIHSNHHKVFPIDALHLGQATKISTSSNPSNEEARQVEAERPANWKENFPWKPTYDAKVTYDPLRPYQFLNGVDATDFTNQQRDDLSAFWKQQSNSEMAAGVNHSFLKKFFQDENRFTSQFEKFCRILKDHERGHNPVMTGSCFWALRQYYHAAYEHESSEYVQRNGKRVRKGLFGYVTWGDKSNELHESLRGWLRHWEWLNPKFGTDAGKAEANALITRLVTEIQGLENLPLDVMAYGTGMSNQSPDYQSIRNGEEEMLVPYVGWFEQSQAYEGIQNRQFEIDFEQGDPSLKEAAPELFPPVDVKNGQLVDKNGDPVKWSENRLSKDLQNQLSTMRILNEGNDFIMNFTDGTHPLDVNSGNTNTIHLADRYSETAHNGDMKC